MEPLAAETQGWKHNVVKLIKFKANSESPHEWRMQSLIEVLGSYVQHIGGIKTDFKHMYGKGLVQILDGSGIKERIGLADSSST